MYEYKARIIKVYDGDTVTAIAELGFHASMKIRIRLIGIDTPEIRGDEREMGLISKARMVELILDKDVIVKTYKDKKGKYGRWLGEIYLPESFPSQSVNQIMLDEGLAERYLK